SRCVFQAEDGIRGRNVTGVQTCTRPISVLLCRDEEKAAIRKRPARGLLAGMYEFPNREGYMSYDDVAAYGKSLGLRPVRIRKLGDRKSVVYGKQVGRGGGGGGGPESETR